MTVHYDGESWIASSHVMKFDIAHLQLPGIHNVVLKQLVSLIGSDRATLRHGWQAHIFASWMSTIFREEADKKAFKI